MITIHDVSDANALYDAFRMSKKGVAWKASVQRYEMNLLRNINDSKKTLEAGRSPVQGFHEFDICERGKLRHIKSVHIKERVVQRSLCDNALVPLLVKGLEYDNSAGQKGKGIHFTLRRLDAHLHQYYRRHGSNEGYILLIDFKGYYDNIRHDKVYERLDKKVEDEGVKRLSHQLVEPFDSGAGRSLGIGSQISQVLAIDYPAEIDHFIKHTLRIKEYARYMDDSYLIHEDKEFLAYCLDEIRKKCAELGIVINERKTHITKLRRPFSFLKVRWLLTNTGKVVKRLNKDVVTRERRKLKKMKAKLDAGEITMAVIEEQYNSWRDDKVPPKKRRGKNKHKDRKGIKYSDYETIKRMDQLYDELFINKSKGGTSNETQIPD